MKPPGTPPNPADIIDTAAVSDMTGLPKGTLRYYRATNQGPASFSLGRRVVYRRSEVERWIAEQEAATTRGGAA
ncbi:Helix-turn-helix domain protein [Mycobacteroides salmoniphilum]|uniref:Helix-turn-helix domain protein n=1 Tax=Mycobacteroides salmoniphilum TaxID=404941 RepID=A0A4R8S6P8_9MYCO|nr:helix-turn-helix domain-containing protein [Mycobacteroides salmoniphilum]TDZ87357.1 Helix-turn-helix domain protein [Mycobacteroides salmoniphilum]